MSYFWHSDICGQYYPKPAALRWRHNGRDNVPNHQPHDCLLNRLFRRRSKKTSKLRVTGLCAGNSPGTGEFPAQMASNAENVSIWWRHHDQNKPGRAPIIWYRLLIRIFQNKSLQGCKTTPITHTVHSKLYAHGTFLCFLAVRIDLIQR